MATIPYRPACDCRVREEEVVFLHETKRFVDTTSEDGGAQLVDDERWVSVVVRVLLKKHPCGFLVMIGRGESDYRNLVAVG